MICTAFLESPASAAGPATSAEVFLFPETKRRRSLRAFGPTVAIGTDPDAANDDKPAAKAKHASDFPTGSDGGNLGRFREGFRSYRRVFAALETAEQRWRVFENVVHEAAGFYARGCKKLTVVDELFDIAEANGLVELRGVDEVQAIIADAIRGVEEDAEVVPDLEEEPKSNGKYARTNGDKEPARLAPILSTPEFLKGFIPPDYIIDGMLQRRFVYSLTGQTGHAKSAIALLLARLIGSAAPARLGTHEVEAGHVVYFVGENPDDIRSRVIGANALRGDDPNADRISWIPGVFNINEMHQVLAAEMEKIGGVDFIIVDTSAAYFLGQDENANPQIGAHARMLRMLTKLPGGPCVLVLCHPIKYTTDPSQLLPRGGGAFLAEMDGNLTAWKHDDTLVELHHNKIRGPGFEPMTFKIERFTTPKLVDSKGREMSTVRAVPITESEEEKATQHTRNDEDRVLAALLEEPDRSIADLARTCDWMLQTGEPHKSKVQRTLERLEKAKLAKKKRGGWALTEEGKDAARKAALRFARG